MSLLKLKLDERKTPAIAFQQASSTESECNACAKKIPTSNKGVTNLKRISEASAIQRQLQRWRSRIKAKKEAMQKD
uniref:Uncharacterized protein n=1 Tax=Ditylenchus dipsaci TaxID=166011 RepID=A0A915CRE0_9BILA